MRNNRSEGGRTTVEKDHVFPGGVCRSLFLRNGGTDPATADRSAGRGDRGIVSWTGEDQTGRNPAQSAEGKGIDPTGVKACGDQYRHDIKDRQKVSRQRTGSCLLAPFVQYAS